jgi:hypothetical protein
MARARAPAYEGSPQWVGPATVRLQAEISCAGEHRKDATQAQAIRLRHRRNEDHCGSPNRRWPEPRSTWVV